MHCSDISKTQLIDQIHLVEDVSNPVYPTIEKRQYPKIKIRTCSRTLDWIERASMLIRKTATMKLWMLLPGYFQRLFRIEYALWTVF